MALFEFAVAGTGTLGTFRDVGHIAVVAGQVAEVGASIGAKASNLDPAVGAMRAAAGVSEPAETARALDSLGLLWGLGVSTLRDDLELLGRGTQAASTLYTHTDESAMGPG